MTYFVPNELMKLTSLFLDKQKEYGKASDVNGAVLKALFKGGDAYTPDFSSQTDLNRFSILNHIVTKLCRYCENFKKGHDDSLDDIAVYVMMLKGIDSELSVTPVLESKEAGDNFDTKAFVDAMTSFEMLELENSKNEKR